MLPLLKKCLTGLTQHATKSMYLLCSSLQILRRENISMIHRNELINSTQIKKKY